MPPATFFNAGALGALREAGAARVLLVTDADTEARGVPDEVRSLLAPAAVHVFADVEPEPGEAAIRAGAERLAAMDADLVVAVGGGSVIDAAKVMRLLSEHPELTVPELALPFLDPRKRIARFPQDPHRARLIAVPTTAGTGSEVSPAAVLTVGGAKLTLVDYSLVPDQAIVEPRLTATMPPALTADTGVDALTHALEAYVSIFASPYSDALCLQAVRMILDALPRAFAHGDDLAARTQMANGATIAGLAFANAFVGRQPRARPRGRRALRRRARACQRALPPARPPLQRGDPDEVHAGARLRRLRRPGQVRRDGAHARARRVVRRALRAGRRAARRARHAADRGGGRHRRRQPTGRPCPSSRWRRSPTSACARTRACRWSPSCATCSRRPI